ncbi:MAG: hypothetical protein KDA44_18150 [Planctomycetales bacterium]|nr:hypothetical protein [Planctomycetales bacterium]
MSQTQPTALSMYSQVDVTPSATSPQMLAHAANEQTELLREVLAAQDRSNELLEELVSVMAASHKQRSQELHQWKTANPELAASCRDAAEQLSRVQVDYLERMTEEIQDTAEDMVCGEFVMNEFVDRFGPRLAHLNGMIQVFAQLSSAPTNSNS